MTILFLYAMLIKNKKAPQEPSRFYLWLVRQNDFLLMSVLRVKIVMRGKELLPKGQRFLIVTNHRSNFDQMVMIKALKEKPMIYISKPDNFKMPIAGPFIKAAGFIPIDRENAAEGIKSIYKAIDLISRPQISLPILSQLIPELSNVLDSLPNRKEEIIEAAEVKMKYAGYIERERVIADKMHRLENIKIKGRFDYDSLQSLSTECRQKLNRINPDTLAQASRIPGVSPSDINVLLVLLGR